MPPRKRDALPKTRTEDEWRALFEVIDTRYPTQKRNHALLMLMWMLGLRVGEALALQVADIDFDLEKVAVTNGKSGARVVPFPGTTDRRNELVSALQRWLQVRSEWNPPSAFVFVTRTGEPLTSSAVRRSMLVYGERAGIGHVTPHMLRHSCATDLLAHGASPLGVSRVLGHRNVGTTLSVYAWAADQHAREAMSKR